MSYPHPTPLRRPNGRQLVLQRVVFWAGVVSLVSCGDGGLSESAGPEQPSVELPGEIALDPCLAVACGEHGRCTAEEGRTACVCEDGYAGEFCARCAPGYQRVGAVCLAADSTSEVEPSASVTGEPTPAPEPAPTPSALEPCPSGDTGEGCGPSELPSRCDGNLDPHGACDGGELCSAECHSDSNTSREPPSVTHDPSDSSTQPVPTTEPTSARSSDELSTATASPPTEPVGSTRSDAEQTLESSEQSSDGPEQSIEPNVTVLDAGTFDASAADAAGDPSSSWDGSHFDAGAPWPSCSYTLTHSSEPERIDELASVACLSSDGHEDAGYVRTFDLVGLGITHFEVSQLRVGVEAAQAGPDQAGVQAVISRIYSTADDPPAAANLTLVESRAFDVADTERATVTIPMQAAVHAATGPYLVAEVFTPRLNGNRLFVGANAASESAPSYLRAPACGVPDFTAIDELGIASDMHLLIHVDGIATGPVCAPR
jgi:hypothetical protein